MPLEWKNVDIPFVGGLADGDHKYVADPPLVRTSINLGHDKTGAVTKRGSLALLDGLSDNASLLFKTAAGLRVFNRNGVYGFKDTTSTLGSVSGRPTAYSSKVEVEGLHAGNLGSDQWDMLVVDGTTEVIVWSEPDPDAGGNAIFPMKSWYMVRVGGVVTQGPAELADSGANLTGHMMRVTYAGPGTGSISGIRWDDRRFFVVPFSVTSNVVTFGTVTYPFTTDTFINFDACSGYDGSNNRTYYVLQEVASAPTFGDTKALRLTHSGVTLATTTVVLATDPASVTYLGDVGLGIHYQATEAKVYFVVCSNQHDNVRMYTTDAALSSKSSISNVYTFDSGNGDYFGNMGQTSAVAFTNVAGIDSSMQVFRCGMVTRSGGGVHLLWQGLWSEDGSVGTWGTGGDRSTAWGGVRYLAVDNSLAAVGTATVANNCSLISKPFFSSNSELVVALAVDMAAASAMHDDPDVEMWTYYMGLLCRVDSNGFTPLARFGADTLAPGFRWEDYDDAALSNPSYSTKFSQPARTVSVDSDGRHVFACELVNSQGGRVEGISAEIAAFRLTGAKVRLDFSEEVPKSARAIGKGAVIGAGTLLHYDGSNLYEATAPTAPRFEITSGNDGSGTTYTWDFYACWAFTDRRGLRWRSPITRRLGYSIEDDTNMVINVSNPPPWQVAEMGACVLELYAQVANVDTRPWLIGVYNVSSTASPTVAIPYFQIVQAGGAGVSGAENLSRFSGGSILPYTYGGELSNDPMGPVLDIEVWDNRIWGIDGDDPSRVWFSKSFDPAQPWGFNRNLFVTIPQGEEGVALARMDESLVILAKDSVYIVQGRGPENTGRGPVYSVTRLESDGGCVNPNSVAICPLGVVFAAEKGIMLLTRGYEVKFIGGGVEDSIEIATISSVTTSSSRGEVVFFCEDEAFTWNYEMGAWSKWTTDLPSNTFSSIEHEGDLFICGDTQLSRLAADPDDLTMQLETSWIKLTGLQGYQAIREVLILGELVALDSPARGQIVVQVFYDYDYSNSETFTYDVADLASATAPMEIRFQPSRRKCKSMKIRIQDTLEATGQDETADNRITISGLTLEVGVKMLGDKMPRTAQAS